MPTSKPSARLKNLKSSDRAVKTASDKIFDVAADLFYTQGIRAVGVETIVKDAGVAKISLYRKFASKDDLIVAYLEDRNADYWRTVDEILGQHEGQPLEQLRSLMIYLCDRSTKSGYKGCPFINFASEFRDKSHPGYRIVNANKREMRRRLLGLSTALDAHRPEDLADALFLLIEGAYASSQTLGGRSGPARALSNAADDIIEKHLAD